MTYEEFKKQYEAIIDEMVLLEKEHSSMNKNEKNKELQIRQIALEDKHPNYYYKWVDELRFKMFSKE